MMPKNYYHTTYNNLRRRPQCWLYGRLQKSEAIAGLLPKKAPDAECVGLESDGRLGQKFLKSRDGDKKSPSWSAPAATTAWS